MKLWVAITDFNWFNFLAARQPDEVNFWQPSATSQFRVLTPGEPLLFKLHSPRNFIVGGGFFSHYTQIPVSKAWQAFGVKNGASSEFELRASIEKFHESPSRFRTDYVIGCIVLQSPFFFPESDWIRVSDWSPNIVRGKSYDTGDERGFQIWHDVEDRLKARDVAAPEPVYDEDDWKVEFGAPRTVFQRLGQGAFRVIVTDSYKRTCAVSSSHVLHVLDAAHIRPVTSDGSHHPSNGLLLRQDIHTLFDRGYMTVTPEHRIQVSRRIKAEFDNGKEYYALQGKSILLPEIAAFRPSADDLRWHNENVYQEG
jgi:putative restriction endonuclease